MHVSYSLQRETDYAVVWGVRNIKYCFVRILYPIITVIQRLTTHDTPKIMTPPGCIDSSPLCPKNTVLTSPQDHSILRSMEALTDQRRHTTIEVEDADFEVVANPTNLLLLPENISRGEAIEYMARTIPANEYGLPLYYLRSDLLDLELICHRGSLTQDERDSAGEPLSYVDGYPTLKSGSPFWTQLPHEPRSNYTLFQRYLELDELEGIRLLDTLAEREQTDLDLIRCYHQEFFWSARARAYDLFIVAAEAKKREVRIRKTENTHFSSAGKILTAVIDRIESDPDLIQDMPAKELFDLFEQMAKMQRLSLGLVGQHASSVDPGMKTPGQSAEIILRQLTKNSGLGEQSAEGFQNRLAALMSDQDTAMELQEMIVRVTSAGPQ